MYQLFRKRSAHYERSPLAVCVLDAVAAAALWMMVMVLLMDGHSYDFVAEVAVVDIAVHMAAGIVDHTVVMVLVGQHHNSDWIVDNIDFDYFHRACASHCPVSCHFDYLQKNIRRGMILVHSVKQKVNLIIFTYHNHYYYE